MAGQPVQQSQEKVLTLSGKDRKSVAEHAAEPSCVVSGQVTLYSRDRKNVNPVGLRQEIAAEQQLGKACRLSGHPVQQRQEKLLTLSGRGRTNFNPVGQR